MTMKKVLIQNELIVQHNGLSGPICAMGLNYFFFEKSYSYSAAFSWDIHEKFLQYIVESV